MANLTTKELTALEDQISAELTMVKKAQAMAGMVTNPQIQQSLNSFAQKHQQHADTLMTFLQ
ncbi:MAG: spore coat protein [Oscillospiraceae bacterium]|nr:spore coat protein [Oscillospiraceae bacterium]